MTLQYPGESFTLLVSWSSEVVRPRGVTRAVNVLSSGIAVANVSILRERNKSVNNVLKIRRIAVNHPRRFLARRIMWQS